MKYLILYTTIFFSACSSVSENFAAADTSDKLQLSKSTTDDIENYAGTLPCADCEGIDVSLNLNTDSSYIMNSVYKGSRVDSNKNHFADTGKWSLHKTDTLYLSTKNQTTKYIKTDTTLMQLDGDGKIITGPLAKMFVLHKK